MSRSDAELQKWGKLLESYTKKGKRADFNRRLGAYKGSLILGREFNESTESYLKRKDLKKFWDWKP